MIKVSSIKFNNELRTTQDLTFLLSCIGEKINVKIGFYYEDITYATDDNLITITPDLADIDLSDNAGIIVSEDGNAFRDTYVGDKFGISTAGGFTYVDVLEKFDNGMVRTTYSGPQYPLVSGEFIFNCTPINGIKYAYNLIENGNSYNSKIDSEYQQLTTSSADCAVLTNIDLIFSGIKSYQIGGAKIKGTGGSGGSAGNFVQQAFIIEHDTIVTPLFLADQYADLLLSIKPDYFDSNICLNYISKISLGQNLSNPNRLFELEVPNDLSNVGWFNERFNGGQNNYSVSSLILKKGITVVTALEFDTDITVEVIVNNTTDSPFSSGNTKYIFGFNYLPEIDSLYQNNGFNQTRNFLFDSKLNTLGSGSANGANNGNALQVIKSVTSTHISATQMKVTATINIGADAKVILKQGDYSRYQLFLITEKHNNSAVNSDKVNLLLQVSEFYVQLTVSNLIETDGIKYIEHPYISEVDEVDGATLWAAEVDDIVSHTKFAIDYAPIEAVSGVKSMFTIPVASVVLDGLNQYEIIVNNKTIATALWMGSSAATATELVSSLNTGVSLGVVFFAVGQPQLWGFDGATGYTATISGGNIIIEAPLYGPAYDILIPLFAINAALTDESTLITNGVDAVIGVPFFPSKINKIQTKFQFIKIGATPIIIEQFSANTASYPTIGGLAQNINFSQDRVFKIGNEIRKPIVISRDFASDTATKKYFDFYYPFMFRWEYWEALQLALPPADIFNPALPLNGINHFWKRYDTVVGWELQQVVTFTLEQNGIEFTQSISTIIENTYDFESNAEWINNSIKSYDSLDNEIINGAVKFVQGFEDTKIIASFEKTSGGLPSINNIGIVLWLETFESGGISDVRRLSSFYIADGFSCFKSTDTSNKVKLSRVGNVYSGECLIDYSKLPQGVKYTIYARLYEFYNNNAKQFMDGDDFEFMDGALYEFN